MTVHDHYTHECPQCAAYYIPYDSDVPCPRCGLVEKERYDFIPIAVASVRWNIEMYGSYVPGAWFVGGLGDHLLLILFHVFERWRNNSQAGFENAIKEELTPREWGEQEYLEKHLAAMARRIYREMLTEQHGSSDEPLFV
jgi:hypothetical protein